MIYGTSADEFYNDKKHRWPDLVLIKALYGTFLTTLNRTNAILFW